MQQMMKKRVITAEWVYTDSQFKRGYGLVLDGGTIEQVAPISQLPPESVCPRESWGRVAIIPGTVNAHAHSFQSLLRGIADDRDFFTWRDEALYRYAPRLGPEGVYAGALLAFGEMLRYGVTTVADFFYVHDGGNENAEAVIAAAQDVGIRLVLARCMYDWRGAPASFVETVEEATRRTRQLMEKYAGHPTVWVCPAPHSPHAASGEMIQAGWRLAREAGTRFHVHVAEGRYEVEQIRQTHGLTPMRWLDALGVVGPEMVAVHCVWLDDEEIALMGRRGASLAYNPASNMFLADGVTRLPEMLRAGVRVALGTDGGCSNNRVSILDEMRTCALLQKVARLDSTAVDAETVFHLGTAGGGEVLGLPVGRLEPGMRADLVALDLDDPSLWPAHNLLKNVVYSLSPTAIRRVVVEGRDVYDGSDLLTVRFHRIRELVERTVARWRDEGRSPGRPARALAGGGKP